MAKVKLKSTTEPEIQEAKSEINKANREIDKANMEIDKPKPEIKKAEMDIEDAKADIKIAEMDIKDAKEEIHEAELKIKKSKKATPKKVTVKKAAPKKAAPKKVTVKKAASKKATPKKVTVKKTTVKKTTVKKITPKKTTVKKIVVKKTTIEKDTPKKTIVKKPVVKKVRLKKAVVRKHADILNYKKYEDIPKKYRWDLEAILGGKKLSELETLFFNELKTQIKIKDSKYSSSDNFLKSLKSEDELTKLSFKIHNYLFNKWSTNIVDPKINKKIEEFSFKANELNKQMGSESMRIIKHAAKLKRWMENDKFADYKKTIEHIISKKEHRFSKQIEEFLVQTSRANIDAESTFSILNDSEIDFGYAISSTGKKTKITHGNRSALAKDKDKKIRETASNNYAQGYLNHKQTLSNLLFQHFKNIAETSKARQYPSAINYLIDDDKADKVLLETLYTSVQENKGIFKKYHAAHKRFYKTRFNEPMKRWDKSVPLVQVQTDFSIEESQDMVLESLEPMGEQYTNKVEEVFRNGWVDYVSVPNKRSGAYSIGGSYGIDKKYILMNYDGTLRSTETLTHELGHSMHSFYSDANQSLNASQYPIFLAEIASIFNELMLLDHLLKTTQSKKLKFSLLGASIEGFIGTIMRQTEWSNYEFDMYEAIEKGEPLSTYEAISRVYFNNSLKYKNNKVKYDEKLQYPAIYVPHFYAGFYVYKYAIGYTVANVFFQRYKKKGPKALENYIDKFLKAGGKDWPIKILKEAGIDLYSKKIYKEAFAAVNEKIKEYIILGEQVVKPLLVKKEKLYVKSVIFENDKWVIKNLGLKRIIASFDSQPKALGRAVMEKDAKQVQTTNNDGSIKVIWSLDGSHKVAK